MTYGEMVTCICQLRDEMKKTEAGREALETLAAELRDQLDTMPNKGLEKENEG